MKLSNKTAIVTGGSSGIGKAIAKRFIKEGAKVIVFDLKKPEYDAEFHNVDVRKEADIKKAFSKIKKVDIVVNDAGVFEEVFVKDTTEKQFDDILDTNLKGVFFMCKYAVPLLQKSRGNIINIASALGVVPQPGSAAYCASKAGVIMITKCLAQEHAHEGVRVNAILPGPIDTPLLRKAFRSEAELQQFLKLMPMKRLGSPEDVANVALFLASDDAGFVTGSTYGVDGGEAISNAYSGAIQQVTAHLKK